MRSASVANNIGRAITLTFPPPLKLPLEPDAALAAVETGATDAAAADEDDDRTVAAGGFLLAATARRRDDLSSFCLSFELCDVTIGTTKAAAGSSKSSSRNSALRQQSCKTS